jgi:hypothetical protein
MNSVSLRRLADGTRLSNRYWNKTSFRRKNVDPQQRPQDVVGDVYLRHSQDVFTTSTLPVKSSYTETSSRLPWDVLTSTTPVVRFYCLHPRDIRGTFSERQRSSNRCYSKTSLRRLHNDNLHGEIIFHIKGQLHCCSAAVAKK